MRQIYFHPYAPLKVKTLDILWFTEENAVDVPSKGNKASVAKLILSKKLYYYLAVIVQNEAVHRLIATLKLHEERF